VATQVLGCFSCVKQQLRHFLKHMRMLVPHLVVQNDDGGAGPRIFEGATPLRQDGGWDKGEGDMAPLVSRELFFMTSMQYSVL